MAKAKSREKNTDDGNPFEYKTCFYEGKEYSGGSVIKMPSPGGDVYKMCTPTHGEWFELGKIKGTDK